jgi:flagellar biosynthesis protein FliR
MEPIKELLQLLIPYLFVIGFPLIVTAGIMIVVLLLQYFIKIFKLE